jgi:hypothetical protein
MYKFTAITGILYMAYKNYLSNIVAQSLTTIAESDDTDKCLLKLTAM